MDRKISDKELRSRKRNRYLKIGALLAGCVVAVVLIVSVMKPVVSLDDVEVSVAESGVLEISLNATGSVVPFYEEVIASPLSTKILEVYKKSGEVLHKGDTILKLDLSSANVDFQVEKDDIEIKKCKLEQYKTTAESDIKDLGMQIKISEMQLRRTEALLVNEHYLDSIGASTKDKVRQIELEYEVSKLQFEQLKLKFENLQKTSASNIKVYELDYKIALDKFAIKKKTLGEAQILAPGDATLSWVNDQVGSSVGVGAQLAILADLSRFKVKAGISDIYAGDFSVGSDVEVRAGSQVLSGKVANVVPSVSNGLISFTVLLDDASNDVLRSGLNVDVFVVKSIKEETVKIANRPYYSRPGDYVLWVVNDGYAEKRNVVLGESSYGEVEVIDGISPGEVVVVSNMSRYRDKKRLKVK